MAGIYIHIPYCKKKCIYCDFYSVAKGSNVDEYIDAMTRECTNRKAELKGERIDTIYIGGGTPSLLSKVQFKHLIEGIGNTLDINAVSEFTVEVNPDDVDALFISSLVEMGVNRISMGVQSFIEEELAFINRRHSAIDAECAIRAITDGGIKNISIDLIYGIPGQTMQSWAYSVEKAIATNVQHISCYSLSYEEGTRLYAMRENGKIEECSEEDCVSMYKLLVSKLRTAGYDHYEISNFAKDSCYSLHNSNYWNKSLYLGLGASAHSYDGVSRRYNPSSISLYIAKIMDNGKAYEKEKISMTEKYDEEIMIRLRTKWGVDADSILRQYGERIYNHFVNTAQQYVDSDLLKVSDNNTYSLSDNGVMLSDMIIRELMLVE